MKKWVIGWLEGPGGGGGGGIVNIFEPSEISCWCTRVKDPDPTMGVFNAQRIYPKLGAAVVTESAGFQQHSKPEMSVISTTQFHPVH